MVHEARITTPAYLETEDLKKFREVGFVSVGVVLKEDEVRRCIDEFESTIVLKRQEQDSDYRGGVWPTSHGYDIKGIVVFAG